MLIYYDNVEQRIRELIEPNDLKHNGASFLTISTVWLCLRVEQTDGQNWFLYPLLRMHARDNYKIMRSKPNLRYSTHIQIWISILLRICYLTGWLSTGHHPLSCRAIPYIFLSQPFALDSSIKILYTPHSRVPTCTYSQVFDFSWLHWSAHIIHTSVWVSGHSHSFWLINSGSCCSIVRQLPDPPHIQVQPWL